MELKEILQKHNVYSEELYNDLKNYIHPVKIDSLSPTELRAARILFSSFEGNETNVIISRFSDENKITRSLVVNALKKLETAGAISTLSLGMKSTHIKIIDSNLRRKLCEENGS